MPDRNKLETFIANNYKAIIGLFIYVVVGYAGYKELQNEVATNKRRTQNYIEEFKKAQKEIHLLEIEIAVLKQNHKNCK